jgi:hypothetical protein
MLIAMIAAIGVVFVVLPIAMEVYFRYRRPRIVACPETGLAEEVQVDAWHAAVTAVPGPPRLYVAECSRWATKRGGCMQRCLALPAMV